MDPRVEPEEEDGGVDSLARPKPPPSFRRKPESSSRRRRGLKRQIGGYWIPDQVRDDAERRRGLREASLHEDGRARLRPEPKVRASEQWEPVFGQAEAKRSEDPGERFRRAVAAAAKVTATSVVTEAVRGVRQKRIRCDPRGNQTRGSRPFPNPTPGAIDPRQPAAGDLHPRLNSDDIVCTDMKARRVWPWRRLLPPSPAKPR